MKQAFMSSLSAKVGTHKVANIAHKKVENFFRKTCLSSTLFCSLTSWPIDLSNH